MKLLNMVKKHGSKITVASGVMLLSSPALAENPIGGAITAAVEAGKSNYTLVVVGLITLCALGFGLSRITSSMR